MHAVVVKASQLAAAAGLHPYEPQADAIAAILAEAGGGPSAGREAVATSKLKDLSASQTLHAAAALNAPLPAPVAHAQKRAREETQLADERAARAARERDRLERDRQRALREAKEAQEAQQRLAARARTTTDPVAKSAASQATQAARAAAQEAAKTTAQAKQASANAATAVLAAKAAASASQKSVEKAVQNTLPQIKATVLREVDTRSIAAAKSGKEDSVVKTVVPPTVANQFQRMARGTVGEGDILARIVERIDGCRDAVHPSKHATCRGTKRLPLGHLKDGRPVVLVGVCDAIDASGHYVLEIKRRAQRLFGKIREYERIQLEAYLRLYACAKGALAESFGDELRADWVEKDDALWSRVVDAVLAGLEATP